ncbi:MAG: ATP-dependent 6-phosphofructokinase [bacterium]
MKLALLTGGGDCPGLNAAIRAVVRAADKRKMRVEGITEGWKGLLNGQSIPLPPEKMSGLLPLGGTILGSSRMNPLKIKGGVARAAKFFRRKKYAGLIAIGGEGTLKVAAAFSKAGLPVVCIPKTIDNDTWGTEASIGFDTAVQVATDAIDRLQTTAESHRRVMIVEVMGRHAGWIATCAGIAGGADAVLIPEEPFKMTELKRILHARARRKKHFSIFVVSEDAKIILENGKMLRTPLHHDEYGDVKLGGIGELLASALRKRTDSEVRVTVLGHVQRGGTPTAFDRILATRLGVHAVELVAKKQFGRMVSFQGNRILSIPILQAAGKLKTVDPEFSRVAKVFFG